MKPDYSQLIGHKFRPKARYPEILIAELTVLRVFYDYPPRLPWEKPTGVAVMNKYIEFEYLFENRIVRDRRTWYNFFTVFEKIE